MKEAAKYSVKYGEKVMAYQDSDLEKLKSTIQQSQDLWLKTWQDQGSHDEGTCCGGKGFQIYYLGKRKRVAERINIVDCAFVQGNVSAQKSSHAALNVLTEAGIAASYNDGWMD